MSLSHSPRLVTNGLVLCLDAADPKSYPNSGNVWYDRSGNGNNASISSSSIFSNTNLGSLTFQYSPNSQLTTPNWSDLGLSNQFTLGICTSISNIYGLYGGTLFYSGVYLSNGFRCRVRTDGRIAFWSTQSGGSLNFFTDPNIITFDETVYFIYITYDGTNAKIYVNGIERANKDGIVNVSTASISHGIIQDSSDCDFNTSQYIAYNRALSPEEVLQNYNATKGRFGL